MDVLFRKDWIVINILNFYFYNLGFFRWKSFKYFSLFNIVILYIRKNDLGYWVYGFLMNLNCKRSKGIVMSNVKVEYIYICCID